MIIFIDGLQNVGKTSLIERIPYNKSRFNFNQYIDTFNLHQPETLKGFQLGKDLGILFLSELCNDELLILDRGPLSTLYYSISENRLTQHEILKLIEELKKSKNVFVWMVKTNNTNSIKREHNDGWDYLDDDNNPKSKENTETLLKLLSENDIHPYVFVNDFSVSIEENSNMLKLLIERIIHEHTRN